MSNQIVISSGAKVRSLNGVITGTTGVLDALPINASNGIPQLDVNGKILVSQLPNSVMEYKGTWNANTNTPTLTNGGAFNQGDVYLCNVAGTTDFGAGPIAFVVGDQVIYSGSIWQRASGASGTVTSVAVTETGDALTITGSPITTSGTINVGFAGTSAQYVAGNGALVTFPDLTGYVTLTTTQTISGVKTFTNSNVFSGANLFTTWSQRFNQGIGILETANFGASLGYTNIVGAVNGLALRLADDGKKTFAFANATTNNTYTFPNASGTVALTSDLTGGTVTSVGLTMPVAFNVASSPITTSGTLAVTAAGFASQYIRGDGTLADFPSSGGGGSSVSYYLNGGTSQGVIGGTTYYEMSKTADTGTGVDFPKTGNGLIVSFLTDANDPAQLTIPGGNWNYEIYVSMSSNGGTPQLYAELYKYDGTTFTLISTSTNEILYDGTTLNLYTFAMAVPTTTLTVTDRLAVKLYATNSGGKTTTVHTQNGHLCQIITTFSTGITALNGLTTQVQYLATGTSGTDFNISSATATHTFNLPTASAANRGALSSSDWTNFNNKQNALTNPVTGTGTSGQVTYFNGTSSVTSSANLAWDGTNLTIGNPSSALAQLHVYNASAAATILLQTNSTTDYSEIAVRNNSSTATSYFRQYSTATTLSDFGVSRAGLAMFFSNYATNFVVGTRNGGSLILGTNDQARVWITSADGFVGIGSGMSSPSYQLDVNGQIRVSGAYGSSFGMYLSGATYGTYGANRGASTASAGMGYYSVGTQKWFTGIYENSDNYGFYSVAAGFALTLAYSTGAASFSSSVTIEGSGSTIKSGNELRFNRADNAIYTKMFDAGSLAANGFVFDNMNAEGFHFKNNGTTIMRMNSAGNVGIGTSSPLSLLEVKGGTPFIRITDTTTNSETGLIMDANGAIRGGLTINYGTGEFKHYCGVASNTYFQTFHTNGSERMRITSGGNVCVGGTSSTFKLAIQTPNTTENTGSFIVSNSSGAGSIYLFNVVGTGVSTSASQMWVEKNTSTNRSINAGGTINASGTDYAEYMTKAIEDNIEKGDIVGVDENGLLTNIYINAKSFVVKSTDPSYVGGDTWGSVDNIGKKIINGTDKEKELLNIKLQQARAKVDRIAFSGQVPCNVYNAQVGDYIIPIELNGKISGQPITNPTFEQYQISVGKVWKIMEDGRAWIAVKIG